MREQIEKRLAELQQAAKDLEMEVFATRAAIIEFQALLNFAATSHTETEEPTPYTP